MSYKHRVGRPSLSGRNPRLRVTVSYLALCAVGLCPHAAWAADHPANDEASFKAAITAANADPGTPSITLTSNVTIADSTTIPALTQAVTINLGAFQLNDGRFNSSGVLSLTGSGQALLAGSNVLGSDLNVTDSTLRLNSGVTLTTAGLTQFSGASTLWLSGAGSVLTIDQFRFGATAGTETIQIENGGVFHSTYTGLTVQALGVVAGAQVNMNVTGAGSLMDVDGQLGIGTSANAGASVTISNGGALTAGNTLRIGSAIAVNATAPSVLVTGPGSSLTAPGLTFAQGTFDVLGGATVTASSLNTGGANATARLLVSGPGSSVTSTGALTLNSAGGGGIATLTDGGALNVSGLVTLAGTAGRTGVLNIGGAEGSAAAAAGVLNTATLTFAAAGTGRLNFNHTGTNYDFAAAITGAGAINQVAGVTHVTANSSAFTGVTTISGGALRVDGTLGGAASSIAVNSGGTLGGSGTIGGGVTVNSGATLAPGNSPGTLTIAGNLTLNAGSVLNMEFGQAGTAGGALNDLIVVGGALTLDGTLNVTQSAGGAFGDGIYRVINYTGALTNNTLDMGSLPSGSGTIQTSIANQINLVVTGASPGGGGGGGPTPPPPTFNFWDGAAGPKANNQVNGGAGTWLAATSDNWTGADGAANGAYAQGGFAIFAGTGGAVTVDASQGQVTASGMQFAAKGYSLQGASVALTGPEAIMRVGDGTTAGAGFTATVGSELTGGARLVKTDGGTLILAGANTYLGGTTVSSGTLQLGAGGITGSIVGDVSNQGVLAFNRSDNLTFGGTISGAGSVRQIGAGATVLTAANSYTGGTAILAGTLQLGAGGSSGSIVGDVADNGALVLNRSDAVTFGGVISGSGSVAQLGGGVTTLAAANSYAGGTTISGGVLAGSASSFGTGAILNTAALVIDQPSDASFANAINGAGSFAKRGAGRLTYTGAGALSGPTTVEAGTLAVNGSLAGSSVTVRSGAVLSGSGAVGGTRLEAGSTIAPGEAVGELSVNGGFTQAAGSTYQVQIDTTTGAADRISATGVTTLAPGAVLNVSRVGATAYRPGVLYTVLHADGGLSGTYTLTGDLGARTAFLTLKDSYDANNVYLGMAQVRALAEAARTWNQRAAAQGADSQAGDGVVRTALLGLATDDEARAAFDQLSGEPEASGKGVLMIQSGLVRDAALARLRSVSCASDDRTRGAPGCSETPDRLAGWAQVLGGWGDIDGDGNAARVDQSAAGFLVGGDAPVGAWRLGGFAGYTRSTWDVDARTASGDSNNYHLGIYGGRSWDQLGLRLGASQTWHDMKVGRSVVFTGFSERLRADYNAATSQAFAELSYKLQAGRFNLEAFANGAYVRLHTDGFDEKGGAAALASRADTMQATVATLGVRPSTQVSLGTAKATVRGLVGWRHAFGDVLPTSTYAMTGGGGFVTRGAPIARDAAAVEAGLDMAFGSAGVASLTYGGQFGDGTVDQRVRLDVRIQF